MNHFFFLATVTCSANEFVCNNSRCIPETWKCDGDQDCLDNSDEDKAHCSAPAVMSPCSSKEFMCANHDCIHLSWKCDGDSDCIDGSDEMNCHDQVRTVGENYDLNLLFSYFNENRLVLYCSLVQ